MNQILLVDDDASFLSAMANGLRDVGQVRTAASVSEAIDVVTSYPIAAIVTDYKLGQQTGYDIAAFVNRMDPAPPVIIMTAFASKEMAIEAIDLRVHAFIEKPFSLSELRRRLDALFHREPAASGILSQLALLPAETSVRVSDETVKLTLKEYEILTLLLVQPNVWISRDAIETRLWANRARSRNVLDTHLTNLKRKLPVLRERLQILRGRGYLLRDD